MCKSIVTDLAQDESRPGGLGGFSGGISVMATQPPATGIEYKRSFLDSKSYGCDSETDVL